MKFRANAVWKGCIDQGGGGGNGGGEKFVMMCQLGSNEGWFREWDSIWVWTGWASSFSRLRQNNCLGRFVMYMDSLNCNDVSNWKTKTYKENFIFHMFISVFFSDLVLKSK